MVSLIESAAVRKAGNGTGSICLTVMKPNRVAWLVLWPNARPWKMTDPQPMLRCLGDADSVAPMLAKALESDAGVDGARAAVRAPASAKPHAPMPAGATIAA